MVSPAIQAEITEMVKALIKRLPRASVLSLVDELDQGLKGDPEKIMLVRRALVQHLNSKRTQHERRLFTNLLQPFLANDIAMLSAASVMPGLLHRHDLGGLWQGLSLLIFPDLVLEANQVLRDLVGEQQPIDKVMAGPRATALRERMRLEAVKGLDAILAKKNRLAEFLDIVNRERRKDILARFGQLKVYPIEQASLQVLRDILAAYPSLLEEMADVLPKRLGGKGHHKDEDQGSVLLEGFRRAKQRLREDRQDPALALLLPLQVLHVARDYTALRQFIRRASQTEQLMPLYEAMHAHLAVRAEAIPRELSLALGINRGWSGPLDLLKEDRALLLGHLEQMSAQMQCFSALGLLHEPRIGQMLTNTLDRMMRQMHDTIAVVVVDRACKAADERNAPADDHDAVVWSLKYVWDWACMLKRYTEWVLKLDGLREQMLQELENAFRQATLRQPTDSVGGRLRHVCRIDQLLRCVDADIGLFVGASNHGLVAVVTHRLGLSEPLSAVETRLAAIVVDRARAELEKIKYWKDAELVALVEIANRIKLPSLDQLPPLPPVTEG